jgi:putative colanic acid biosysnthesis UDP-glucose lipid carrier transferase
MDQIANRRTWARGATPRRFGLSYSGLQNLAALVDMTMFVLAGTLGFAIYEYYLTGRLVWPHAGFGIGIVAGAFFGMLARSGGLYSLRAVRSPGNRWRTVWVTLAIAYLLIINGVFLLKVGTDYSRGSMVVFGALAIGLVTLGRVLFSQLSELAVRRGVVSGTRAVAIGEASELEKLSAEGMRSFGFEEIARVGVGRSDIGSGLSERSAERIQAAINLARQGRASEFILAVSWSQVRLLDEIGVLLRASPLPVKLLPDAAIRNITSSVGNSGLEPDLAVEIQRAPLSGWERLTKRYLDVVLSFVALVLLAPLFLITAILIKLDSAGPVLFRQRRCGFDNQEFVIFKFRTMTTLDDGDHVVQARRGDARLTRIGALLRRSSIDELPQLLNVIRGEMSLVGPRPHAMAHNDQYNALIATYALRHHVKPGITGMAQTRGLRGATPELVQMERRVEQDIWYINHWSLTLDLWIMAKTCTAVFRQEAF